MSHPAADATLPSLLDAVRQIEPVIRAYATDAERDRRLSDPVADAMRAVGLYRMWRPKALGGLEVDPMSAFRVLEEVARIDSAAGWNLQLSTAVDALGAWFPDDSAAEILAAQMRASPEDSFRSVGQSPLTTGIAFPGRRRLPVAHTKRLGSTVSHTSMMARRSD